MEQAQANKTEEKQEKKQATEKCTCVKKISQLEKRVETLARKLELFEKVLKGRR